MTDLSHTSLTTPGLYAGIGTKLLQSVLTASFLFVAQRRIFEFVKKVSTVQQAARVGSIPDSDRLYLTCSSWSCERLLEPGLWPESDTYPVEVARAKKAIDSGCNVKPGW
jgi:hypothetical protein